MRNLLARLLSRRTEAARPAAKPTRLRLEGLEVRDVPSAVVADYGRVSKTPQHTATQVHQANFDHDDAVHNKTVQKTIKKNILAAKNLSPGNYSVSYRPHH